MLIREIIKAAELCQPLSEAVANQLKPLLLASGLSDRIKAHLPAATFEVWQVGKRKTRMLIMRDGGLTIPLPLAKIEGKKKLSNRAKVSQCCRELIYEQIAAFRLKFWAANPSPRCPISNRRLTPKASHVDHIYPFVMLMEDWCRINKLDIDRLKVTHSRRLGRFTMGDTLDASWRQYHFEYAQLQMLSPKANLQKGKKL